MSTRNLFSALIAGFILLLSVGSAFAQNHARVSLLSDGSGFESGETVRLGVLFEMDPDWHIYWRYGGETGLPPSFTWTLPDGFDEPSISWPVPEFIEQNSIVNYGYHDEVVLFADIKVPEGYKAESLPVDLGLEWLICKDICIPEFGEYEITLDKEPDFNVVSDERLAFFESRLPEKTDVINARLEVNESSFNVIVKTEEAFYQEVINLAEKEDAVFFAPYDWGYIKASSRPAIYANDVEQTITLKYPRGNRPFDSLGQASGVFVINEGAVNKGYKISGDIKKLEPAEEVQENKSHKENTETQAESLKSEGEESSEELSILMALIYAFLGGLILNLMPCVFPILSLKALSLVKVSGKDNKEAILSGVSYSAGVILSFVAIAAVMIAIQAGGASIGWGFQLQDRSVLYVLTLLMFLIGLSLIGALRVDHLLPQSVTGIGQSKAQKGGLSGSFFTGLLATIVAAPCTAPFMAGAIGVAATMPPFLSLTIFAALGAGLAFPYMLLTTVPASRKFLPKPGAWMEAFRQFLAFPMFATALWLGLILVRQDEYVHINVVLVAVLSLAFVVWLFERKPKNGFLRLLRVLLVALGISVIIYVPIQISESPMPKAVSMSSYDGDAQGVHYKFTRTALEDVLESQDAPVFVYLTADWCITCKVNERRVLSTDRIEQVFQHNNVKIFKGDWTKMNSDITQYLQSFNRNGVPLYIYYGPKDMNSGVRPEPVLLPQLLAFKHIENLF